MDYNTLLEKKIAEDAKELRRLREALLDLRTENVKLINTLLEERANG